MRDHRQDVFCSAVDKPLDDPLRGEDWLLDLEDHPENALQGELRTVKDLEELGVYRVFRFQVGDVVYEQYCPVQTDDSERRPTS